MNDYKYEEVFLRAAAPELKAFLLSKEIYWNLGLRTPRGQAAYPQFSLGWLLLYKKRIAVHEKAIEFSEVLDDIEEIRNRWRSAWSRKAEKEFESRLKLWTRYMNEIRKDFDANKDRYAYEVHRRTMLELLREEAEDIPVDQNGLLGSMDLALKHVIETGPFVGHPAHAAAFPKQRYWFLYADIT